jgi:pyruvate dehydrogenase E2 component (dihydrolipoamide acetyltransferase)
MPQLGETVADGKITLWYKSVGDAVVPGDNLFEIETEKVSMEVPAISAGVLTEIRVGVGDTAPVGAIVAVISDAASALDTSQGAAASLPSAQSAARAVKQSGAHATQPIPPRATQAALERRPARKMDPFHEVLTPERNYGPARTAAGIVVTPLARRMAAEIRVDLSGVAGSGPGGRILGKDIEAMRGRAKRLPTSLDAELSASSALAEQVKALYEQGTYFEQPIDGMRRVIARRLTESKQTIPHFYLTVDLEVGAFTALREELNRSMDTEPGSSKVSLTDLLIKAWALALQRVPLANAVWANDRMLRFTRSDIGVAVAVEGGLVTPVIRGAESKSPRQIASAMKDLATRARLRRLAPEEMRGGVTSISNLGMYGVREFSAIINPPQSTILAVGASERRAVEAPDGAVRFASRMTVTLSCDHRVVDGALGAELIAAFGEVMRRPSDLLT